MSNVHTEREGWRSEASCSGMTTAEVDRIFFPSSMTEKRTAEAKAICATCPVNRHCLAFAVSLRKADDTQGIFGGLTPAERNAIRRGKGTIVSDTIDM